MAARALPPPKKLLDQVRDTLRRKHYSFRTEQAYLDWFKRFILFHDILPAHRLSVDPRNGMVRRHHLDESGLQKAIRQAGRHAGISKAVSPHTLRHCFATHLLEAHYDIRTMQGLLGHKDVRTTKVYTHVLQRGGLAVRSPLDG